MFQIQIRRIYEEPKKTDGARVFVDRLWARGLKKEDAELTLWMKEAAPSGELRRWFHAHPSSFSMFADQYIQELETNPDQGAIIEKVKNLLSKGNVTLLYGSKDTVHNNAIVLQKWLDKKMQQEKNA